MRLRGAVVGVGYLGNFHAQKIKAHPGAVLAGVCDFAPEQARKVAAELGTTAYEKPEELIGKVDYVHIAASTQSHFDLAALFLNQQIPVLVEKPIAATIEQAEKLCELADKRGAILTVGHIERFNPAYTFLRDQSEGVRYLELNRLAPFRVRGSDVSVLHDLTIHDIDLVNWIFRSPIAAVEAAGTKMIRPTYDDVALRLTLGSGVQVSINNSRISPQIVRNYRAVSHEKVIAVNTATLETEILRPVANEALHTVEKAQLSRVDALALEADHFIRCVRGEVPPAITAAEATQALKDVERFIGVMEGQKS